MDSNLTLLLVVIILAIVILAFVLRYRGGAKAIFTAPFGAKVEVEGKNRPENATAQPPASPSTSGGATIEDATSRKGGARASDKTGQGATVRRVDVEDDIVATSQNPESAKPNKRKTDPKA